MSGPKPHTLTLPPLDLDGLSLLQLMAALDGTYRLCDAAPPKSAFSAFADGLAEALCAAIRARPARDFAPLLDCVLSIWPAAGPQTPPDVQQFRSDLRTLKGVLSHDT